MLFRICDYYDYCDYNHNTFTDEDIKKECFICYEVNSDYPFQLNTQTLYNKRCNCQGYIHKKCLDMWYESKHSCPICRNNISKNISIKTRDFLRINNIYNKKIPLHLLVIFTRILFIYYIYQFYSNIYQNINDNNDK